ncbi:hypothetical protein SNEBB_004085 [Seison nebaliae]|nr:hypothetical protein SNEBB_004085 [Seison nebaliae]
MFNATNKWNRMIDDFRTRMPTGKHRKYLRTFDNCFYGSEAVKWFEDWFSTEGKEDGTETSKENIIKLLGCFQSAGVFQEVGLDTSNQLKSFNGNNRIYKFLPKKSLYLPTQIKRHSTHTEQHEKKKEFNLTKSNSYRPNLTSLNNNISKLRLSRFDLLKLYNVRRSNSCRPINKSEEDLSKCRNESMNSHNESGRSLAGKRCLSATNHLNLTVNDNFDNKNLITTTTTITTESKKDKLSQSNSQSISSLNMGEKCNSVHKRNVKLTESTSEVSLRIPQMITGDESFYYWKSAILGGMECRTDSFKTNRIMEKLYEKYEKNLIHNLKYFSDSGVVQNIPNDELSIDSGILSAMKSLIEWPKKILPNIGYYRGIENDIMDIILSTFDEMAHPIISSNLVYMLLRIFDGRRLQTLIPHTDNLMENEYDERRENILKSMHAILLLMKPANRRLLHLMLRFIRRTMRNGQLRQLYKKSKETVLITSFKVPLIGNSEKLFRRFINQHEENIHSYHLMIFDEIVEELFVCLINNQDSLFNAVSVNLLNIPSLSSYSDFHRSIHNNAQYWNMVSTPFRLKHFHNFNHTVNNRERFNEESMYHNQEQLSRHSHSMSTIFNKGTTSYCQQVSEERCNEIGKQTLQIELEKLLHDIVKSKEYSEKIKQKHLEKFQLTYPSIYEKVMKNKFR